MYSQIFYYPFFFGFLLIPFLWQPIAFFRSIPEECLKFSMIVVSWGVVSIVGIGLELIPSNHAVWEVRQGALTNRVERELFTSNVVDCFVFATDTNQATAQKSLFENTLSQYLGSSENFPDRLGHVRNWSFSKYAYICSVCVQVPVLIAVVCTMGALASSQAARKKPGFATAANWLVPSLLLTGVWLLMYSAFVREKRNLYVTSGIKLDTAIYVFQFLYIISLLYLAALHWHKLQEKLKGILTFLGGLGVSGATLYEALRKPLSSSIVGRNVGMQSYCVFWLSCVVLLVPWIASFLQAKIRKPNAPRNNDVGHG